jgi:hypothetical protein
VAVGVTGQGPTCPLCGLLDTLGRAHPEAVDHLRTAAGELLQALRDILREQDSRGTAPASRDRVEQIHISD